MKSEFKAICEQALEYENADDCKEMEPYFQRLISLAKAHKHSEEIKSLFIDIVYDRLKAPYELLSYCMRELKYPQVLEASKERLGKNDPRYMNYHSDLVHSYNDDKWEQADLWKMME